MAERLGAGAIGWELALGQGPSPLYFLGSPAGPKLKMALLDSFFGVGGFEIHNDAVFSHIPFLPFFAHSCFDMIFTAKCEFPHFSDQFG